jgi:hypothetical protein
MGQATFNHLPVGLYEIHTAFGDVSERIRVGKAGPPQVTATVSGSTITVRYRNVLASANASILVRKAGDIPVAARVLGDTANGTMVFTGIPPDTYNVEFHPYRSSLDELSSQSTVGNVQVLPPPPATPTGVAATAGNRQVTVTWNAVASATSYRIYRGLSATVATLSTDVTTTSFVDQPLSNGTPYFYWVSASNAGGASANSTAISATPKLPAPTGLTVTPQFGQATLAWNAVPNATGYKVKRGTTVISVTTNSYTNTALTNGTAYAFSVAAVDGTSPETYSGVVNATPAKGTNRVLATSPIVLGVSATNFTTGFEKAKAVDTGASALTTSWQPLSTAYANATLTIDLGSAYAAATKSTNQVTVQVKCASAATGSISTSADNVTFSTPVSFACTTASAAVTVTTNQLRGRYVRVKNTASNVKIDVYNVQAFTN